MSDALSTHDDSPHEGPIKTPKQLILAVIFSFVVPIFAIVLLVSYVTRDLAPPPGSDGLSPQAVAARLQPVGRVEIKDASNPAELKNGEQVFAAVCTACHTAGVAGAPKLGDVAAWAPRLATGYPALLTSALKGKGAMAAQGGGDYSDLEIGRAVVYLANKAGGKFEEPAAAAGANAGTPKGDAAAPAKSAKAEDASVVASAGQVKLYFASGKAELPAQAKAALETLAAEIKAGGKTVQISGFHDTKGSAAATAELAKQRAIGTRDLLVAAGIGADKIELKKPQSTTGDGAASEARRVEVTLR
jgi:cytochrome c5